MIWSVQILMIYRKQVDKIDTQITMAQTDREEVIAQAETYEVRGEELADKLNDLKSEVESLEGTEKGLQKAVVQFQQQATSRRPTRHRIEPTDESGG